MSLTMGLMWNELEESRRKKLDELIQKYHYLNYYWVLETCKWIGNNLHRRFLVFGHRPRPMLGTVCYYRDNQTMKDQEIMRVWCLPLDLPVPDGMIDEDTGNTHPGDDAIRLGVPLIY